MTGSASITPRGFAPRTPTLSLASRFDGSLRSRGSLRCARELLHLRRLERARAEQKIDDVAFVRLEPVELNRRDRTEVQPVDVHGIDEPTPKVRVIGDRAADKRRSD